MMTRLEEFDAHKYIGLPMQERVEKVEKEISFDVCVDYLERFGYVGGDYRGLKGDSLRMYMAPWLKLFQQKMDIPLTGERGE